VRHTKSNEFIFSIKDIMVKIKKCVEVYGGPPTILVLVVYLRLIN
jgi:hypothetical protein